MNKERKEIIEKKLQMSFEDFVIDMLREAEEISYGPYETKTKEEIQLEFFNCNIKEDYISFRKYWFNEFIQMLRKEEEIKKLRKEEKIKELQNLLKQIQECEPVKTGKQVAKDNIRQQIVLINLYEQDEVLIDGYEKLFGLNLDIMTEEEINSIDLTTLVDARP